MARPPRWEGWSENVSPGTPRPRWTAARSLAQLRIQEESAPLAPVKPCDSGRLGVPAPSVTPRRAQPTEERASTSLQTAVVPARPGSRQATRTHARFRLRHCPKPQPAGCPMSPRPSQSRPCRGQDLLVLTQVKIGRAEPSRATARQRAGSRWGQHARVLPGRQRARASSRRHRIHAGRSVSCREARDHLSRASPATAQSLHPSRLRSCGACAGQDAQFRVRPHAARAAALRGCATAASVCTAEAARGGWGRRRIPARRPRACARACALRPCRCAVPTLHLPQRAALPA